MSNNGYYLVKSKDTEKTRTYKELELEWTRYAGERWYMESGDLLYGLDLTVKAWEVQDTERENIKYYVFGNANNIFNGYKIVLQITPAEFEIVKEVANEF